MVFSCYRGDSEGRTGYGPNCGIARLSSDVITLTFSATRQTMMNDLFGEIAMLDGKPRSANATALTKCELLVLGRRDVIPFLEKHPAM
jgi:CRP-like cAMP-binding protein